MIKNLLTPSFLFLSCFVIGGMFFNSAAPRHCGKIYDNDSKFVLTGDERRIPFAIRKMQEYPNADLYIIGVGAPNAVQLDRPVIIESKSKSTYQNALAIKKIANDKNLDRIVVITTEDHINRAKHLIHSELPNTEIVACPATLVGMTPAKRLERWTTEYIKYIVTMIGIKES